MSAEPAEGDYQLTANQLAAFKEAFEVDLVALSQSASYC